MYALCGYDTVQRSGIAVPWRVHVNYRDHFRMQPLPAGIHRVPPPFLSWRYDTVISREHAGALPSWELL